MSYLVPFISLLNEMSPYLLLGFLIAGVLKVFVPNDRFIRHLSRSDFKSVLWSALVGVPLPLCSCGVIPTGMSLRKEGASRGATVAFLISTPQTGADSIAATYSVLGLPFALLRPVAAFITSLFGGLLVNRFDGDNSAINSDLESSTKSDEEEYRNKNKLMQVLHYSFVEMLQDIGKWLILGILFAGLIAIFLPDSVFSTYLNNPLLNMLIVLAVAVPTYTCATGSIPMAAALMMKGLSPGAALVFLMAGPATSIASMTVIGKALGRRSLLIYLFAIIVGAMLFGLLIDYALPADWFDMSRMNHDLHHAHHDGGFSWFGSLCSIALIGLIINAYFQKIIYSVKLKKKTKMATVYKIGGMSCNHCKARVEKALAALDGVTAVQVDLSGGIVYVEGSPADEIVRQTVENLGFEYKEQSKKIIQNHSSDKGIEE
jgi:uncharacterized membrane protein YraQ (UPF0718 family)